MTETKFILKTNEDKAYFYYGEKLIFQSGKSMPFIVLKKNKNGVETSVGLSDIKLNKTDEEEGYEIEFSGRENKATVSIKTDGKTASIEIKCDDEFDEMCFTLYGEDGRKVYGLPSYKQKFKKRTLKDRILRRKQPIIKPDMKLSFFINDFYFFENVNIADYKIDVKDNIYITTTQKKAVFKVIFARNVYAAVLSGEKDYEKIKKYPSGSCFVKTDKLNVNKIKSFSAVHKTELKGVIINERPFDYGKIKIDVVSGEKNKLDVIFTLTKKIALALAKKYFDKNDYEIIDENNCVVKLDTVDRIRKYLVVVRKYLDVGASGIYFDGNFTRKEILDIKEGMKTVINEYVDCSLFHSAVNESNDDFGYYILKDEQIINNYDRLSGYYLYSGELLIGKEQSAVKIDKKFSVNIFNI